MKRILAFAICSIFVLGLAATVFAGEVTLGGDMRVRGVMKSNYDFSSDADTASKDWRYWDQRMRVTAAAKVNDKVAVKSRITFSEGVWGQNDIVNATYKDVSLHDDDYAQIEAKLGPGTMTIGRQLASWGNRFAIWDVGTDRVKYVAPVNETVTLGVLHDKKTERNDGDNGNDYDDYGALALVKFGQINTGLLLVHYLDGSKDDKNSGQVVDLFMNGPAGPVALAAELILKPGDLFKDSKDNMPMGAFVAGTFNMDALSITGAIAYAANKFETSKYFTPTLFFGTSQATGLINFCAPDDESSFAVVAAVDFKVNPEIKVGGKVAMADNFIKDASVIEVDATFAYMLGENATWFVDFGYLIPDKLSADDDSAMALAQRLEVKF